ncbi:AAA family ATPase [Thermomicrobium sp. 4228-Ro]|uniref:bifunctional aminoglycoside phosphotransferase/ATP-binding protein n=1 Tax=Thermomicrobium sp. 4228-Ro TaxID=2993937 RepID=UPI002248988E|nr:AAA family ATPase [Thermomicrobium sp. 4228-Ro]MCX2726558.1 AAA family ATPase [Thermomicrobium sp. 4228-Ro]
MTVQDDLSRAHRALILSELSRPEAYPFPVDRIDVEETHISLVFLVGDYAYKVKKPVNFGFLDFSTLERRRFFCEQEVLLNQRLTDGVYLGVVPIARVGSHLRVEAEGEIVEYAVKMRRLDFEQTLLRRVQRGSLPMELVSALADRLAAFYRTAARSPEIDQWGTPEAIWFNIRENLEQTEPFIGVVLAPIQHRWIASISERFLRERLDLFQRRITEGRIVEGHGDLHLAHIFVESESPPRFQIVDCIEFNPRLRCGDVAVDLAFLSMDFDHHGRSDFARWLTLRASDALDDPELPLLVHFYSVYRAHVRNKVNCFRLAELAPESDEFSAVRTQAERYIDLATSYLVEPAEPLLLLIGGLSGTGKSALARRLARCLGIALYSSDIVRKELAGVPVERRVEVPYGTDIYGPEFTRATYRALLERAAAELATGRSVVLDATFLDREWREAARALATRYSARPMLVECCCPAEIVEERLRYRAHEPGQASEATWPIYLEQRARYGETMEPIAGLAHLTVDTAQPLPFVLDVVLTWLPLRERL